MGFGRIGWVARVGTGKPLLITPKPGQIYYADIGADENHRVVVVSREQLNRGKYVVVVPVTSEGFAVRANLPNCVPFSAGQFGFDKNCVAQAEQIATFINLRCIFQFSVILRSILFTEPDDVRGGCGLPVGELQPGQERGQFAHHGPFNKEGPQERSLWQHVGRLRI